MDFLLSSIKELGFNITRSSSGTHPVYPSRILCGEDWLLNKVYQIDVKVCQYVSTNFEN